MIEITDILADRNPWWSDPDARVARHLPYRRTLQQHVSDRLKRLGDRRALVVLGFRQVGKTVLLRQTIDELLDLEVPCQNITYFDFADDRIVEAVDPEAILKAKPLPPSTDHPVFFFFDEIGRCRNWDLWLKRAVDEERGRFVVTDSAATLLRDKSMESGFGRWDEYVLEGLSFREFSGLRGLELDAGPALTPRLTGEVERYLRIGGLPEYASPVNPIAELLDEVRPRVRSGVVDQAIGRDLRRFNVDIERIRRLFVYLVEQSGAIWQTAARARDLDANEQSVNKWLDLLEDTLLIRRLEAFHRRAAARLRAKPKYYAADPAFVVAFATAPASDPDVRSRAVEAAVFRHLRELARERTATLTYARRDDDLEVDFVFEVADRTIAIEVTSARRVRPRKVDRLVRTAPVVGADACVLIHGGVAEDVTEEVLSLPLPSFLIDPSSVLGES